MTIKISDLSGSKAGLVPTGGTSNQVLAKKTNADNDVQWVTNSAGGQRARFKAAGCSYIYDIWTAFTG